MRSKHFSPLSTFFSWPHLSYICTLGLFYFCFELFCYFLMPLTKFYQTWSIEKKPSITIVGEVYCVLLPNHTYLRTFPLLFLKQTPSNWIIISVTISYRFFFVTEFPHYWSYIILLNLALLPWTPALNIRPL